MQSNPVTIKAELRPQSSRGAIRAKRAQGAIPGVLYSKGKATSIEVVQSSLPKGHTHSSVVQLDVAGETKNVLMREVQVHPITDLPLHFDFQEVTSNDRVRAAVPLKYVGFSREQEKEGSLVPLVRFLDVVSKLSDLPSAIDVDVSTLKGGNSVRLFDVSLPAGVTVRTGKGQNVALVSLVKPTA